MRQHQPILERVAKTAIARTAGLPFIQAFADKYLERYSSTLIPGNESLTFLGAGWEQIVFEDMMRNEVVKLLLRSGRFPVRRRDVSMAAEEFADIDRQCAEVAPDIWLSSNVSTAYIGSRKKIVLRQPHVQSALPHSMKPLELMKVKTIPPELKRRFAQGVLNIIEKVGVVPDLEGPNNVLYGNRPGIDRGITIVDTIPLKLEDKGEPRQRKEYDQAMKVVEAGGL